MFGMLSRISFILAFPFITSGASAQSAMDGPASLVLPPGGAPLPMDVSLRKPVVDAKINGKGPFKFFLARGTGRSFVDPVRCGQDRKA